MSLVLSSPVGLLHSLPFWIWTSSEEGAAGSGPESPCDVCHDLPSSPSLLWVLPVPAVRMLLSGRWGCPVVSARAGLWHRSSERQQPKCLLGLHFVPWRLRSTACTIALSSAPFTETVLHPSHSPSLHGLHRWSLESGFRVHSPRDGLLSLLCPILSSSPFIGSLQREIPSLPSLCPKLKHSCKLFLARWLLGTVHQAPLAGPGEFDSDLGSKVGFEKHSQTELGNGTSFGVLYFLFF